MNKSFILELQQELLAAGYDDVELRYLCDLGKNVAINLTFKGIVRHIGLFIEDNSAIFTTDGDIGNGIPREFTSAKDLACQIFDRDPGTSSLPDFRKFTGFKYV